MGLIQGNVPDELKTEFDDSVNGKKLQVGRVVEVMAKIWVSLPDDIQLKCYADNTATAKEGVASAIKLWKTLPEELRKELLNQSSDSDLFVQAVEEIVLKCVKSGYAAGVRLSEIRDQQQGKKGSSG